MLRVPGTRNHKFSKYKKRPQLVRYVVGDLIEARATPAFTLAQFENSLGLDVPATGKRWVPPDPDLEGVEDEFDVQVTENSVATEYEQPCYDDTKVPFDFEKGWEEALQRYQAAYGLRGEHLDESDRIVFRYLYKNRLREQIFFTDELRRSLTRSGTGYAELRSSVDRIARAGRPVNRRRLVYKVRNASFGEEQPPTKDSYEMSPELAGLMLGTKKEWISCSREYALKKVDSYLYQKGERNFTRLRRDGGGPGGLCFDALVLGKAGIATAEIEDLLTQKVLRSHRDQPEETRCSEDVDSIDFIVQWVRAGMPPRGWRRK